MPFVRRVVGMFPKSWKLAAMKAVLLDMLRDGMPGLAEAAARAGAVIADRVAEKVVASERTEADAPDLSQIADPSFGLRGEAMAVLDTAGEAVGLGPISALDLNAASARMSAMEVQKRLAAETVNIVNCAPDALMRLLC